MPKEKAILDHPIFNLALIFYLPSITGSQSFNFTFALATITLNISLMAIFDYLLMRLMSNKNQI